MTCMLSTNVLQESLHATNVRRKATTIASVFQKTVLEVTAGQSEEDIDVTYLSAIVSEKDSCWTINIEINGKPMIFKLDTGAEVTAITESTLAKIRQCKTQSSHKVSVWA